MRLYFDIGKRLTWTNLNVFDVFGGKCRKMLFFFEDKEYVTDISRLKHVVGKINGIVTERSLPDAAFPLLLIKHFHQRSWTQDKDGAQSVPDVDSDFEEITAAEKPTVSRVKIDSAGEHTNRQHVSFSTKKSASNRCLNKLFTH